ncbi:MAG: hypothetical protein OWU33_08880 [Firmicutes bacterium]|nr:hypothetical protein [Bacillota bacterium]
MIGPGVFIGRRDPFHGRIYLLELTPQFRRRLTPWSLVAPDAAHAWALGALRPGPSPMSDPATAVLAPSATPGSS